MRPRGQAGQTAAEYLGLLVLVAVIVGALVTSDAGAVIRDGVKRGICSIARGGESCGEPEAAEPVSSTPALTTSEPGGGDGYPDSGPDLDDAPYDFPVLPFPGTVGFTCSQSLVGPKGTPDCRPADGPFDFGVRAGGDWTRDEDGLDNEGCPATSLGFSGNVETYGRAGTDGARGGGSLEGYAGKGVDYSVTTTPDRADDFENGDADLPNPVDPRTLETGEGIELTESYYEGIGASGQYRALQGSLGFESGRALSSGVEKLDSQNVRIYVGDADYVQATLNAGIGLGGGSLGFGGSSTRSLGQLRAIDVDLSTPAGWRTYQNFARTGEVPPAGTRGTSNPTTSETADAKDELTFGYTSDRFDLSTELAESDGTRTVTTDEDGNVTYAWSGSRAGRGVDALHQEDADGNPLSPPQYGINLTHVDDGTLDYYGDVTGQDVGDPSEDGNVRLEYTEDELRDIQQAEAEVVQDNLSPYYDGDPPSTDEIIAQYQDGDDSFTTPDGGEVAPSGINFDGGLLAAETPDAIALALSNAGSGGASGVLSFLSELSRERARIAADRGEPYEQGDEILGGRQVTPSCV